MKNSGLETCQIELMSPKMNKLFAVLAKHDVSPTRRTGIPRSHTTDWEATRMCIEAFRRTVVAAGRAGTTVRWYKGLDVATLHRCVTSFNWGGTLLEVTADILSSIIVAHPFPNANHRTAISLVRLYLGSQEIPWPSFELRGRGIKRFVALSTPFIVRSKYLLQTLRHRRMILLAVEEGFTHLSIAEEQVEIDIAGLRMKDSSIRRRHLALSKQFVDTLANEDGQRALRKPSRSRLREWVLWYGR